MEEFWRGDFFDGLLALMGRIDLHGFSIDGHHAAQLARLTAYELDLYQSGDFWIELKLDAIGEDGLSVGENLVREQVKYRCSFPMRILEWLAHAKSHLLDLQQNTVN